MSLDELLEKDGEEIIAEAVDALTHTRLKHYEESSIQQNRLRLTELYELTRDCIKNSNLIPMLEYAHEVARECYQEGFDLQEVQMAFNVIEEVVWKRITAEMSPSDYRKAFGLVSTALGEGKQALAVEYVSLASQTRDMKSLDLRASFGGT